MKITIDAYQTIILKRLLKKQISDIEKNKKSILKSKLEMIDDDFKKSLIQAEDNEIKAFTQILYLLLERRKSLHLENLCLKYQLRCKMCLKLNPCLFFQLKCERAAFTQCSSFTV